MVLPLGVWIGHYLASKVKWVTSATVRHGSGMDGPVMYSQRLPKGVEPSGAVPAKTACSVGVRVTTPV